MAKYLQLDDPYLQTLSASVLDQIESRREAWAIRRETFYPRLARWFANFDRKDKDLALKILLRIDYYSADRFRERILQLRSPLDRFLSESGRHISDIVLVTPAGLADSADRHAYDVLKTWGLANGQIQKAGRLNLTKRTVVVLFNDTHGTGSQFLREVWPVVKGADVTGVFVLAVTLSAPALRRFKMEMKGVRVLPDVPVLDVTEQFTAAQYFRIKELGRSVYPRHPLGYGGTGLLVAYYFQCPNNTLPLIWANGENNRVGGRAYHWNSLFPYIPKKAGPEALLAKRKLQERPLDEALLAPSWSWTKSQLQDLFDKVEHWRLNTIGFYEHARDWFGNFEPGEQEMALELFLGATYLGRTAVTKGIQELGQEILRDIRLAGGSRQDILIVTTGDERESVYHYVYDFLRTWGLEVDQACAFEELHPSLLVDRTLVFFYHTRRSGAYFVRKHWPKLSGHRPRAVFLTAYAMADKVGDDLAEGFNNVRFARIREASRPVRDLVSKKWYGRIVELTDKLTRNETGGRLEPLDRFLTAYYFQTPMDSSPLLWAELDGEDGWRPLFPRKRKFKEW